VNPYFILAGVLAIGCSGGGGFLYGRSVEADACDADKLDVVTKVESTEDTRDENIEAIATAAATATAAAMNANRGSTNESTERIRTVVVPGACRAVDPAILFELRQARDDANAALGIGVRPAEAGTAPSGP
jgi:hypothetical protein